MIRQHLDDLVVPPGPGVWQRGERSRTPGFAGSAPATWVETDLFFGTLARLPEAEGLRRCPLAELSQDQLLAVAAQRALIGRIERRAAGFDGVSTKRWVEFGETQSAGLRPWAEVEAPDYTSAAAVLVDPASGSRGMIIRSGSWFAYGRGAAEPGPAGRDLADLVRSAPTREAAIALLDREISIGRIDEGGAWTITESTLPGRIGVQPGPELCGPRFDLLNIAEVTTDGSDFVRTWRITEASGLLHTLSAIDRPARPPRSSFEGARFAEGCR